ncbi:accessory gene regulator B family protein [Cohnella silvisoli]|uniref:Accessory gene regulator B family protein n=1 Tax=Cohnella silvisoli TaxID=2873699 RepID=A0ABV1KTL4_9BACL|nr:accessory gene regulator B family protein [Cohnella silvisoli]MCD9022952.1 accessory gene regulator B family protein [Cohnella silvisoli]
MFDKWALNAATWINNQNPKQTASVAVLHFALTGLLNSLTVFFIIIVIGAITGHIGDSLLASLFFVFLHFFSGGFHFKSVWICTIFSSSMMISSFLIPLSLDWLHALTIFTIIILIAFAPSNIENHARISKRYFPLLKLISVLIVTINLFMQNTAVCYAIFLQALLVIPYSKLWIRRRWELR